MPVRTSPVSMSLRPRARVTASDLSAVWSIDRCGVAVFSEAAAWKLVAKYFEDMVAIAKRTLHQRVALFDASPDLDDVVSATSDYLVVGLPRKGDPAGLWAGAGSASSLAAEQHPVLRRPGVAAAVLRGVDNPVGFLRKVTRNALRDVLRRFHQFEASRLDRLVDNGTIDDFGGGAYRPDRVRGLGRVDATVNALRAPDFGANPCQTLATLLVVAPDEVTHDLVVRATTEVGQAGAGLVRGATETGVLLGTCDRSGAAVKVPPGGSWIARVAEVRHELGAAGDLRPCMFELAKILRVPDEGMTTDEPSERARKEEVAYATMRTWIRRCATRLPPELGV